MSNKTLFLTPMLLIRGCPINKIDDVAKHMGPQPLPGTPTEYIKQVDEAIKNVVYEMPSPPCSHDWSNWVKDGGFFFSKRLEHRVCAKCQDRESREY